MSEDTFQVKMPLGELGASTPGSLKAVALQLMVSDHDLVAELLQKPEGRQRDEYALTALRIGLLSLKHARGQIDAEAVLLLLRAACTQLLFLIPIWNTQ